jgi:hypothetical protein
MEIKCGKALGLGKRPTLTYGYLDVNTYQECILAYGDWSYENNEREIKFTFKMFTNDGSTWQECSGWEFDNVYTIEIGDTEDDAYQLPGINDLKNKWILQNYTEGS